MSRYLINPFDEADRQIEVNGRWVVATVAPRISWPKRRQLIAYDEIDFVLLPQTNDQSPAVAVRADAHGIDASEARKRIMRFCSALSWAEGGGLEVVAWGGGNLPRPISIIGGNSVTEFLNPEHLPLVETDESRSALALYREGVSIKNPFYGFLSLFKAVSVIFPDGKKRAIWIDASLEDLDESRAKDRRDELIKDGVDVGQYIWDEGRNAIAHAEQKPYVNPDETEDHYRLHSDIPLIKNLAELAIEQQTGIKRPHTLWKEHLYELKGFRELIPDELMHLLENSKTVPEGTHLEMPDNYTVLARRGGEVHAFENLKPEIAGQVERGIALDFITDNGAVRFRTVLDFSSERLIYDPVQGMSVDTNRDDKERVTQEITALEFQQCILGNGHLEVWDAENEKMLGRSETCIPVNCMINHEFYESELAKLRDTLSGFTEEVPS